MKKRNCACQASKTSRDTIARDTRYWQRLEKSINASCALMMSETKNCRGLRRSPCKSGHEVLQKGSKVTIGQTCTQRLLHKRRRDTARQPHPESIHAQAKTIARSSAETELYAAALGACESEGILSLLKDLGYEMKPVSVIDAKATEHIHRGLVD